MLADFIKTLHLCLRSFVKSLIDDCLSAYATYHHKNTKHQHMMADSIYVPASYKIGLNIALNFLQEVRKSEYLATLNTHIATATHQAQASFVVLTLKAHNLNHLDMYERIF